jgi:hypothetical protein
LVTLKQLLSLPIDPLLKESILITTHLEESGTDESVNTIENTGIANIIL